MAEALALGRKKSEVVPAPRGQVHLVDKLPVIHQKVGLEAVEVDPLAGDEAAVGPVGKRRERGAQMSSQAGRGKVSNAWVQAWRRCFQTWARRWRRAKGRIGRAHGW